MDTISCDTSGTTLTLSDKAMIFLQQLDAFWWEVSQCTKCHTVVLDSELVASEDGLDCGCGEVERKTFSHNRQ